MSYAVKEIFLTLQGEGMQAGRRAVFLRFAGCNLWTGREEDRGDRPVPLLRHRFRRHWMARMAAATRRRRSPKGAALWGRGTRALVVVTGGEPMLQLDAALIDALHVRGFEVAVETNGTLPAPAGLDWICVSPKAGPRWSSAPATS